MNRRKIGAFTVTPRNSPGKAVESISCVFVLPRLDILSNSRGIWYNIAASAEED